jgi:hypothetical protein
VSELVQEIESATVGKSNVSYGAASIASTVVSANGPEEMNDILKWVTGSGMTRTRDVS